MALDKEVLDRLGANAQLVYDETKVSANTHTRVGQAFIDTHTLFEEVGEDESAIEQLQKDVDALAKQEESDVKALNDSISALAEKEEEDIASVNASISALKEQEEKDIDAVNERIDAITPRLILPLYQIIEEEVTIQSQAGSGNGWAVWCSANKAFAWETTPVMEYYGSWGAYGIYPNGNVYLKEIPSGEAVPDVWYYVATEGAFYYWNGEEMEKITDAVSLIKSDLTEANVATDCDYLLGVKNGELVRLAPQNVFVVKETEG